MRPLLTIIHFMVTPTKDCNLQEKEVYTYFYSSFLQEFNITCLSRGRLLGFSDCCEHWLLNLKGGAIFCNIIGSKFTVFKH